MFFLWVVTQTYSSFTHLANSPIALTVKISTNETYIITPAARERQAARKRFLDDREYGMTKARAAPRVVLNPAAATMPNAIPT